MKSRTLSLLAAMALAQWPAAARACTVCMGGDDSKIGPAINGAIFLLLGCIGGVLALLVAFAITLIRRANAPLPPEAELSQS